MNLFPFTIKSALIVAGLSIVSSPVYSDTNPIDITGSYICSGNDVSDNSQYTVDLTVTKVATKSGDVYQYKGIEKGINDKTGTYLGTGVFARNSNNTIAAVFWQENDPTISGVTVNQIQPDGSWESNWTWRDKPGINMETCKKKQ